MFLFDKYEPKHLRDIMFNKEIVQQLLWLATNENIPHIIISGPPGGGKKTILKFFLEALYDDQVNVTSKVKYSVNGPSSKKDIDITQSDYHIVIEPTNTNHDKYILQEIINQYASHMSFNIFSTNRKFKTIVIHNIECLTNNSQAALRRTMEKYARSCRFIMVCNNLSKILDPLKSRCRVFCVPLPSLSDISDVITRITYMENISLTQEQKTDIILNCNNSLSKAILMLDCIRLEAPTTIALDNVFEIIVDCIMDVRSKKSVILLFSRDIRSKVYDALITNIKGSDVIRILMNILLRRINNDEINARIIQHASNAEYNMVDGRRDFMHIDYFVTSVMVEIHGTVETRNGLEHPKPKKTKKK